MSWYQNQQIFQSTYISYQNYNLRTKNFMSNTFNFLSYHEASYHPTTPRLIWSLINHQNCWVTFWWLCSHHSLQGDNLQLKGSTQKFWICVNSGCSGQWWNLCRINTSNHNFFAVWWKESCIVKYVLQKSNIK